MRNRNMLDSLLASIQTGLYQQQQQSGRTSRPVPFITISRQAGAGGRTLAGALADRLNEQDPGERPWTVWDRELVEKVAHDEHIPQALVESLERGGPKRGAFLEFLASLSARDDESLDEFQVYRRAAHTIRGLARAGRAILVGRGGVYATGDLPGGVHLRLVAPFQDRVAHMAQMMNLSEAAAAREVRRIDACRDAFHRRYWPDKALLPEIFTMTLNAAAIEERKMADCVLPLILQHPAPPSPQAQITATA